MEKLFFDLVRLTRFCMVLYGFVPTRPSPNPPVLIHRPLLLPFRPNDGRRPTIAEDRIGKLPHLRTGCQAPFPAECQQVGIVCS